MIIARMVHFLPVAVYGILCGVCRIDVMTSLTPLIGLPQNHDRPTDEGEASRSDRHASNDHGGGGGGGTGGGFRERIAPHFNRG